ncbi:jacalin-related lectin 3-like [Lingula anatina]|uniref:Jacalin-related lectin 3-like n=1 Tax=Lingula anatina TaxID=7574 RepID=A0A1S3J5T1_LINAN|nr:jacalin-related lectin 3-like [Lingula anatina]|eukprot:XP_013405777.1 jacalin-related lectin 3-like [Lingula anatina]
MAIAALLLILIFVGFGQAEIRSAAFKMTAEYRQQGGVSQSLGGHSREDCSMVCLVDMSCVGINYHQGTGVCETYGSSLPAKIGGNAAGWVHLARLGINLESCYFIHGPYGCLVHHTFNDEAVWSSRRITGANVRAGLWTDSIQFEYSGIPGQKAGGDGGALNTMQFAEDEFITRVVITLRTNYCLQSLTFHTNLATYGPYGVPEGRPETVVDFSSESRLRYISGRYATSLNAIAFHEEVECGQ